MGKDGTFEWEGSVGSRSAIRGTPLLPANRRENTWSSYQETYIRGIYKIPDVVIVNEYVRTRLYPIVRS